MSIDIIARALATKASQVTGTTSGVDGPISSTPDAIVIFDGPDPLNQAISIVAFDVHIEKDSVGSSMLYIK